MNTLKADVYESSRSHMTSRFIIPSQRQFFLILLAYFGLQTLIRSLISGTVDLDESEQLILTQKFSWGYGSQPPLYTWIQMLFFNIFGVSVFALALFKNLLLLSIYVFTYLNVRFVTRSHVCGMLGAISLLFIPQVAWESQRDLTHSVLAAALVTATLFVFLRIPENPLGWYVALGICAGLGILSKYNYGVFLFGLLLAGSTMGRFRSMVFDRRILLSLAACFALLLPHLLWAFGNRESLASTTYKFRQQESEPFFSAVVLGVRHLFSAVIIHIAPALLFFAVIFRKKIFSKSYLNGNNDYAKLILRKYGFILAGLILAILVLRITGFKDRWFEPIFISLPLLLFAVVQDWIEPALAKTVFILGSLVALAILIVIPSRILFAEPIGWTQLLNAPFLQMENELNAAIPSEALIITENKWIGGNLRLLFPHRKVVTPELAKLYSTTNRPCVVVWDATGRDRLKPATANYLENFTSINLSEAAPVLVEENYQYYRAKKFRLGISTVNR